MVFKIDPVASGDNLGKIKNVLYDNLLLMVKQKTFFIQTAVWVEYYWAEYINYI